MTDDDATADDPRRLGDASIEELTVQLVYRLAALDRPELDRKIDYVALHVMAVHEQAEREWREMAS